MRKVNRLLSPKNLDKYKKSIEMVSEDKLVFWTPRRRKDWPAESIVSSWFYLHPILAWMNANPDSST